MYEHDSTALKCSKCGTPMACMGGRSAHRSNWFCPDCDDDLSTLYKIHNAEKKLRHAQWYESNCELIVASGITYSDKGESLLFREVGKPKVDFYPSTGRWRTVGKTSRTYNGGAKAFIVWYKKQKVTI